MSPTLFSEVQRLFERTYANVGINLEDCLIDRTRCRQLTRLAGAAADVDMTLEAVLARVLSTVAEDNAGDDIAILAVRGTSFVIEVKP